MLDAKGTRSLRLPPVSPKSPTGVSTDGVPGYSSHKPHVQRRLHRIEGQVRGPQQMVDDDRYCIDVLTQASAVKAAPESVALLLLADHTEHCVAEAIRAGHGEAQVNELNRACQR